MATDRVGERLGQDSQLKYRTGTGADLTCHRYGVIMLISRIRAVRGTRSSLQLPPLTSIQKSASLFIAALHSKGANNFHPRALPEGPALAK